VGELRFFCCKIIRFELKICFFSDAKSMAVDVRNIILNIIQAKGNMTEEQAQAYYKKMETQKRISMDVWS